MNSSAFRHMLAKCREARDANWRELPTRERLAAALVLSRPDWLQAENRTIPEALSCIGPQWAALVPLVAGELELDPPASVRDARRANEDWREARREEERRNG